MALQKFDDLWFRIALSEQAESRGTKARKPRPYPALHLALASINIYNEKYEIYKRESNAKGRRYSKE